MIKYNQHLKEIARQLRTNMTESEKLLWSKLRRKQVLGLQFYRQKPIGNYIVDFYSPQVKMVIELDGGQHFKEEQIRKDDERSDFLRKQELQVLRFKNLEVLQEPERVMEIIYQMASERLGGNPPQSPFTKGEPGGI